MFEIMVQARMFPAMYPNSAKMALGWPTGRKQPKMAINRDLPGLCAFLANFAKLKIRGSKVQRVLGPLDQVMAILVAQPAKVGGSFQAENGLK